VVSSRQHRSVGELRDLLDPVVNLSAGGTKPYGEGSIEATGDRLAIFIGCRVGE